MRRYLQRFGYIAGFLGLLLALVALLRVGGTYQRVTDVREELLMVAQGIRLNDIRSLSTRLEGVREDLSKMSTDLRTLTGEVQGARTRLDQMAKDLAGLGTRLTAVETSRLEDVSQRLGVLTAELARLQARLSRLEEEQAKLLGAIARLDQLGQELSALRAQVAAAEAAHREQLEKNFGSLSQELAQFQARLAQLSEEQLRVGAALIGVDQLSQELAVLRSRLAAVEAAHQQVLEKRLGGVMGELARLQGLLDELQAEQAKAVAELSALGLRVGVVDAETLFLRVFLPQVAAERASLQAKAREIQELQARYAQGQLRAEAYQRDYAKLQAESLQAQARVNLAMLEKMIASPGFANLRTDLRNLRAQVQPLMEEVDALVLLTKGVGFNYAEFLGELQNFQAAFQQVDQLLTQVAAVKILEVAQQVAQEQGYHLVLRTKDVVMYFRTPVTDLSGEVEERLWPMFAAG